MYHIIEQSSVKEAPAFVSMFSLFSNTVEFILEHKIEKVESTAMEFLILLIEKTLKVHLYKWVDM